MTGLTHLRQARHPVFYFSTFIGDAILTLPTLRALSEIFSAPITLVCPRAAFELCFWELGGRFVEIAGLPRVRRLLARRPERSVDYDNLCSHIGAVDLFINGVPWESPPDPFGVSLRQRLAPTTSIGFPSEGGYDIVVPRTAGHAADLIFQLASLFEPSARIETYAQPMPLALSTQQHVRSLRAAHPVGTRVLVVHADTVLERNCWPVTRFIDLLDRFLFCHRDFVAWVVGVGHEELNVGRERDRVFPYLGVPPDLTVGLVSQADLFVGIDSCMLHAADLARVPSVGLFGPTESTTWGFRFAPHRHIDRSTMDDIAVEEVLGALDELVQNDV